VPLQASPVSVSAKTVERWEDRNALPANPSVRARLAKLQELADLGLIVYTPEGFIRFLTMPHPALRDRTPLQLIEQGQADAVLADLAGEYEGLGF
jgi:uncharacterized protein (DUF2384 family)